jgi:hypothetical protein
LATVRNKTVKTETQTVNAEETYQVIQVKGGKFHRPDQTTRERGAWFRPIVTACHHTVTPLNVFSSEDDALSYTGGREQFLCRKCFPVSADPEVIGKHPDGTYCYHADRCPLITAAADRAAACDPVNVAAAVLAAQAQLG